MNENSTSMFDNINGIRGVLLFYLVGLTLSGAGALVIAAMFGEKVAFGVTPVLAVIWVVAQLISRESKDISHDSYDSGATDSNIDDAITSTLAEVENLRVELRGRLYAALGVMMGELSIQSESEDDFDAGLVQQAIDYSWGAYEILKGSGIGTAEYMALNNLVFFLSIQGDERYRDFVLAMAKEIRFIGEKYSNAPFLLTYCRAIIRYGGSPEELEAVRHIAAKYQFDPKVRSEARRLRTSLIDFKGINSEDTSLPERNSYRGVKRRQSQTRRPT